MRVGLEAVWKAVVVTRHDRVRDCDCYSQQFRDYAGASGCVSENQ